MNDVVFSPDGKYIATASNDHKARIWDAATGKQAFVLSHDGWVNDVVFSPDRKYIATASADSTARLWTCSTKEDLINEASNRLTRNLLPKNGKNIWVMSLITKRFQIYHKCFKYRTYALEAQNQVQQKL
ncbi:WD40 repeat domain-containing protein [Methanosarcina barkeri]|uniref:WD40 repeat domain-containing protein n=1 Tax=Methanosarcina barkeri TaxID=2208 RepID=UPI0006D0FA49|nr:PD40 domain-containing protein [Methanosarcina barkeri]